MKEPTIEDKIALLEEEVKNKRNWQVCGIDHLYEYLAPFRDKLLSIFDNTPEEMTVEQICEELGRDIKIVK